MTRINQPRANYSTPEPMPMPNEYQAATSQELIAIECDKIKAMLLEKNRKYGDSAINPRRIFSKSDAIEQINVRIDDKLSRIQSGQTDDTEDAELDLIGYLILKRVAIESQSIQSRVNQLHFEYLDFALKTSGTNLMKNENLEDEQEWM